MSSFADFCCMSANGLLQNPILRLFVSHKQKKDIPIIRKLIDADVILPEKINETIRQMMLRLTGIDISCCPKCQKGKMIRIKKLPIQDDLKSS